jgi:hypothetical protein
MRMTALRFGLREGCSPPDMDPRWLFPVLAAAFAVAALRRWARRRGIDPAARTWLLLALIFGLVSGWLWLRT